MHVDHFVDRDWTLTVDEALGARADDFAPLRGKPIDFGYTRARIWLRVRMRNVTEDVSEWRLFFAENFKQIFDVYLVEPDGRSGTRLETLISLRRDSPFSTRPIAYPELVVPMRLEPGAEATVLVSLWSEGSSYIEFAVLTRDAFDVLAADRTARNSVFYGAMSLLIVISLAALVFLRRLLFLAYALYAGSALLYIMHADGATFQYLWPNAPRFNSMASVVAGSGLIVFGAIFSRLFLRTRELHPWLDKVLLGVIIWTLAVIAILLPFDPQLLKKILVFTSLVALTVFASGGVVAARTRFPEVRFYLFAWVGAVISAVLLNLNHLLGVGIDQDTLYDSMRAVMVFDAAMMGLAIADGYNQLRQSRQAALERGLAEAERNLELNRRLGALDAQYTELAAIARAEGEERLNTIHDLRTPLNALRLNVGALLSRRQSPEDRSRRSVAARGALGTDTQTDDLDQRVEDTFNYLEALMRRMLDTPKAGVEPVAGPSFAQADGCVRGSASAAKVGDVLRRARDMFAEDAEEKGLDFLLDVPEPAASWRLTEPLNLLRVISNLIANAIAYTSHGGIALRLREHARSEPSAGEDYEVAISVEDTGPGLSAEEFELALQRNERLQNTAEITLGHGLGLSIVREISDRHDWPLLHTAMLEGTRISLVVPCFDGGVDVP